MARTRQKLGLHVGSNYPRTNAALQGCINDATDLAAFAKARGYDSALLLEPTDRQYVAALRNAVSELRYADTLFHSVSGHGSTLAALRPGTGPGEEPDGQDECLVFAQEGQPGRMTVVRDDELADVFDAIPVGARVIFLSDVCFSGGLQDAREGGLAVRSTAGITSSQVSPNRAARYLPPDELNLPQTVVAAAIRAQRTDLVVKPRPSRVALLSACDASEVAWDASWTDGRWRGAFTATLLQEMQALEPSLRPGTRPALRTVHEGVRRSLPSDRYPQTPRLDASWWQRNRWTL